MTVPLSVSIVLQSPDTGCRDRTCSGLLLLLVVSGSNSPSVGLNASLFPKDLIPPEVSERVEDKDLNQQPDERQGSLHCHCLLCGVFTTEAPE